MRRRQRLARPFGLASTPFDPKSGTFAALGDHPVQEFTIVAVGHDVLLCSDRGGRPAVIAKPWRLRKSTFHGLTVGGVTYASTDIDERTATLGAETEDQVVVPGYAVGEKVLALKRYEDAVSCPVLEAEGLGFFGDMRLWLEDANTAGRAWAKVAE